MHFASNLRYLRRRAELSQSDLGDLVGVDYSAIGRYENAKSSPNFEVMAKLASVLKVSVEELRNVDLTAPAPAVASEPTAPYGQAASPFAPSRTPAKHPILITVQLDGTHDSLQRAYARLAIMNDAVADTD